MSPDNTRVTLNWCIFGFPSNPNTTLAKAQCLSVCAGSQVVFQAALTENVVNVTSAIVEPYAFCEARSGAFGRDIAVCQDCLDRTEGTTTLVNCK